MLQEWLNEPEHIEFTSAAGYHCTINRVSGSGYLCGYVGIPPNHPMYGCESNDCCLAIQSHLQNIKDSSVGKRGVINLLCHDGEDVTLTRPDMAIDVHGSITYSRDHDPRGKKIGLWWFGFDCCHAGDHCPDRGIVIGSSVYRNIKYVKAECERMAAQLKVFEQAAPDTVCTNTHDS